MLIFKNFVKKYLCFSQSWRDVTYIFSDYGTTYGYITVKSTSTKVKLEWKLDNYVSTYRKHIHQSSRIIRGIMKLTNTIAALADDSRIVNNSLWTNYLLLFLYLHVALAARYEGIHIHILFYIYLEKKVIFLMYGIFQYQSFCLLLSPCYT